MQMQGKWYHLSNDDINDFCNACQLEEVLIVQADSSALSPQPNKKNIYIYVCIYIICIIILIIRDLLVFDITAQVF